MSSLPFRWYKTFATEGGVRCPAIIRLPEVGREAGTIYPEVLSVRDFAPTILEYAGVTHPGTSYKGRNIFPMDGSSMRPYLTGKTPSVHPPEKAHCWELYGRKGVRKGPWKAEWLEEPYGSGEWELYNLDEDLGEQHNLASTHPEKLEELVQEWEAYVEEYEVTLPSEPTAYGVEPVWREERGESRNEK